jgi:hypothetical protein
MPPLMQIGHLLSMCDDTGLLQHAIHAVPDRAHGYCVDDNARALLVACALNAPTEKRLPETFIMRLASFVQHAWNPDTRRFRNSRILARRIRGLYRRRRRLPPQRRSLDAKMGNRR